MGSIIRVVAVLEIHMLSKAVASMKPNKVGAARRQAGEAGAGQTAVPAVALKRQGENKPPKSQMKRGRGRPWPRVHPPKTKQGERKQAGRSEGMAPPYHHSIHQAVPAKAPWWTSPPGRAPTRGRTRPGLPESKPVLEGHGIRAMYTVGRHVETIEDAFLSAIPRDLASVDRWSMREAPPAGGRKTGMGPDLLTARLRAAS